MGPETDCLVSGFERLERTWRDLATNWRLSFPDLSSLSNAMLLSQVRSVGHLVVFV